MPRKNATSADVVTFGGIRFRRYPNAANWADRSYYTPGPADKARGVGRLHEEIWKSAHGPVPDGCEIHHADFDPLNNDPSNLACLTVAEHKDAHRERGRERASAPAFLEHLDRIRPLAAGWHGSPEGLAWHREHAAAFRFGHAGPHGATCEQCGKSYETTAQHGGERFCSNACKSAWRRASGADDEERRCANCGKAFTVNRYSKTRCCGRKCAQRLRAAGARAGVEPDR